MCTFTDVNKVNLRELVQAYAGLIERRGKAGTRAGGLHDRGGERDKAVKADNYTSMEKPTK